MAAGYNYVIFTTSLQSLYTSSMSILRHGWKVLWSWSSTC